MSSSASASLQSGTTKFQLPDLISQCPFDLHVSRHRKQVTTETRKWLSKNNENIEKVLHKYDEMKCGWLTAMTYPGAAYPQLRVCNDFLAWIFHYDNLSDDMDAKGATTMADTVMNALYHPGRYTCAGLGNLTRDYWKRLIQTASPGTHRRFLETMSPYLQGVVEEADDHTTGARVHTLESNIALRRATSGMLLSFWTKPSFVMIEYAYNLDLPDEVMDHPLILSLECAAGDLVAWSNDIYSFNVEQSKGQNHNMVTVAMNEFRCDLQTAMDHIGKLCMESMDRFVRERSKLPSWGPQTDQQVNIYLDGLADWMAGNIHWSFKSHRYFGKNGSEVKRSRMVNLLPRRK
ncbi:terpenoid synthase [Marasmius fiardii PR-910]|nr:terpenoid synthase [Marasmius fiardii PR-910]